MGRDTRDLTKPLRPFFIHPSTSVAPYIPPNPSFTPIICLSASRWVNNGADDIPSVTRLGQRTVGFDYVPGGGDDDELWARGLTPTLFHSNKALLLAAERDDLPSLVDEIVEAGPSTKTTPHTISHQIGVPSSSSRLALDIGPAASASAWACTVSPIYIDVVEVEKYPKAIPFLYHTPTSAILAVPSAKSDGKAYTAALNELVTFARTNVSQAMVLRPGKGDDLQKLSSQSPSSDSRIVTTSPTPIDSRKCIIPLALVLLCSLPELANLDDAGNEGITKDTIADKLHSLVALWPDGNPPRAALKRVNEYLMSDGKR